MADRFDDHDQNRRNYNRGARHGSERDADREDRGFMNRAADEVRAWFGDEEAERRRRTDDLADMRGHGDRGRDSDNAENDRWRELKHQGDTRRDRDFSRPNPARNYDHDYRTYGRDNGRDYGQNMRQTQGGRSDYGDDRFHGLSERQARDDYRRPSEQRLSGRRPTDRYAERHYERHPERHPEQHMNYDQAPVDSRDRWRNTPRQSDNRFSDLNRSHDQESPGRDWGHYDQTRRQYSGRSDYDRRATDQERGSDYTRQDQATRNDYNRDYRRQSGQDGHYQRDFDRPETRVDSYDRASQEWRGWSNRDNEDNDYNRGSDQNDQRFKRDMRNRDERDRWR